MKSLVSWLLEQTLNIDNSAKDQRGYQGPSQDAIAYPTAHMKAIADQHHEERFCNHPKKDESQIDDNCPQQKPEKN